jgi:hypothetical protein
MWYSTYLEQPFCRYLYTFVLTNGTAGSADYTTTDVSNCSCWCNYWNVSVPTTADTIDEVDETFSIANGTVSATGTIIDNNNAYCGNDHPASATEGSDVFDFTLSNPAVDTCILCSNKWYGWKCGLHDYRRDSNCSCWSNYWNGRYQQLRIQLMKWRNFALHWNVSATGTIIDNNNAPTVATITLRLPKECCCVYLQLSNPSVDTSYTFVLTNGTLEVRITRLLTLP